MPKLIHTDPIGAAWCGVLGREVAAGEVVDATDDQAEQMLAQADAVNGTANWTLQPAPAPAAPAPAKDGATA